MKIILFDDTPEQLESLFRALVDKVGTEKYFIKFSNIKEAEHGVMFEERIKTLLSSAPYDMATLIVADRDLSKTTGFIGLSESAVRKAAMQLAIPECSYQRNPPSSETLILEQREAVINVQIVDMNECAEQILSIDNGFAHIKSRLRDMKITTSKKTPGLLLASILDKPDYAEKISLYSSGDQNRIADIVRIKKSENVQKKIDEITCLIGYWLWDSVMKYPGVLLNDVAASSYLNILQTEFKKEVEAVFDEARYRGPFWRAAQPLWWRAVLDDILEQNDVQDGAVLTSNILKRPIAQSVCCENPKMTAGYYCMLSNRPVSLENSQPGLSWFPRGADLARISNSQIDQLGPWL